MHQSFIDAMGDPHKIRITGGRHEGFYLFCLCHFTLQFQQPLNCRAQKRAPGKNAFTISPELSGHGWSRLVTGWSRPFPFCATCGRFFWSRPVTGWSRPSLAWLHAGSKTAMPGILQLTHCLPPPWNVETTHDMNGKKSWNQSIS